MPGPADVMCTWQKGCCLGTHKCQQSLQQIYSARSCGAASRLLASKCLCCDKTLPARPRCPSAPISRCYHAHLACTSSTSAGWRCGGEACALGAPSLRLKSAGGVSCAHSTPCLCHPEHAGQQQPMYPRARPHGWGAPIPDPPKMRVALGGITPPAPREP